MRREAHLVENEFVKGEWQSELVYAISSASGAQDQGIRFGRFPSREVDRVSRWRRA